MRDGVARERKNQSADFSPRKRFRAIFSSLIFGVTVFLVAATLQAQKPGGKTEGPPLPTTQAEVARGKYIVEDVAMCGECHTPRNADGSLDRRHGLQGAPVFLQPPKPDPDWPIKAPRIGGNPPASDEDMVKLLTTGNWTNGKPLRFPMMPFRMNEADAKAVVAYLKTVEQQ